MVLLSLAAARPLSAQLQQPEPYQRLVAAVRLRSLMSAPITPVRRIPAPPARALPTPSQRWMLLRTLHIDLFPGVQLLLNTVWLPTGTRTTVGLALPCF